MLAKTLYLPPARQIYRTEIEDYVTLIIWKPNNLKTVYSDPDSFKSENSRIEKVIRFGCAVRSDAMMVPAVHVSELTARMMMGLLRPLPINSYGKNKLCYHYNRYYCKQLNCSTIGNKIPYKY